jgi:antitoxin ParD1/3/4
MACRPRANVLFVSHKGLSTGVKTVFGKICQTQYYFYMGTMNISLPDSLKSFVDEQVSERQYGTSSEYVRELIRKDQDRQQLRKLLVKGGESPQTGVADSAYFESLRARRQKSNRG